MKSLIIIAFCLYSISASHNIVNHQIKESSISILLSYPPTTITCLTTAKEGQVMYMGTKDSTISKKIRKYEVNNSSKVYLEIKQYIQSKSSISQLVIYKDFLIAVTDQYMLIQNESQTSTFNQIKLTQTIAQMVVAQSKGLLMFSTKSGNFGYLQENDMLLQDPMKLNIVPSIFFNMAIPKLAISSDQKYVAIYSNRAKTIKIFLTETLTQSSKSDYVHFETEANSKEIRFSGKKGQENVFISLDQSGNRVYLFQISENAAKTAIKVFPISPSIQNLQSFGYSIALEKFIGTFKDSKNNHFSFQFQLSNIKSGRAEQLIYVQQNFQFNQAGTYSLEGNTGFLSFFMETKPHIKMFSFSGCKAGSFYNYCQRACQVCSDLCSMCSPAGCGKSIESCITDNSSIISSNPSSNNEILQHSLKLQYQTNFTIKFTQNVLGNRFTTILNKFPGSRKIFKSILGFFINFDDLWLYNYHNRQYSRSVETFFQEVKALQDQKWQLIPAKKLWILLGIDISFIQSSLNFKPEFTSDWFNAVQQRSNGFFLNTIDFILSNCLLITVMFLLLKLAFEILKSYKFSLLLREYSFLLMLPIIMLDGNIQLFSYLFTYEISTMISKKHWHKLHNVKILIIFFLIIILCIFMFFHAKQKYGKLNKYFLRNVRNSLIGTFYMILNFSIRNLLLGIAHYSFQSVYEKKMVCLLSTEFIFLISNIFQLKKNRMQHSVPISKLHFWICGSYCGILRIILILIFLLTKMVNDEAILIHQNQGYAYILNTVLVIYLLLFITFELTGVITALMFLKKVLQCREGQNNKQSYAKYLKKRKMKKYQHQTQYIQVQRYSHKQECKTVKYSGFRYQLSQ